MSFLQAMRRIALRGETDWDGWRAAARALALSDVPPEQIRWTVGATRSGIPAVEGRGFNVSRALVSLAGVVLQARDPTRFDLLYRLIWRAQAGALPLDDAADEEVRRARGLALAVRAEAHRMRTQLRYLALPEAGGVRHLGWYVPAHYVLEANARVLARRFPDLVVSILTPEGGAHWDANGLRFGAGADPEAVPDDRALAAYWRAYGSELLTSAQAGSSVPEAEELLEDPWPPDRPPVGPVVMPRGADPDVEHAAREAADCRRCPLFEPATQTVFGEGPAGARLMFVGEQPGDQEDVVGRPFVGPAGRLLDRAMAEAGIDRRAAYVTNAVKHFKFVPRGKRRIHQTPETIEIKACAFWLDVERVRLTPKLIVLLGATAARAVLARPVTIGRERGRPIRLSDTETAFVTVHPSFLLRVPDEDAKRREYRAFVEDLRKVAVLASADRRTA
jgi:probable DNA metabolism protein